MSARLEMLAREKQGLLVRSSLSRLRLRREARELRASLRWPRVAASAAPPVGALALGFALTTIGLGRIGRFVALAGRVVFYARLVRSVIGKRSVASA
jgi:hypothetical protein